MAFDSGWLVWPEGEPERAVFCRSIFARWWKQIGPMGWFASLRGRRIRYCAARFTTDPARSASNMEVATQTYRKDHRK